MRYIRKVKTNKGLIIKDYISSKDRKIRQLFKDTYGGWGSTIEIEQFKKWLLIKKLEKYDF